jgi:hypothetical protein
MNLPLDFLPNARVRLQQHCCSFVSCIGVLREADSDTYSLVPPGSRLYVSRDEDMTEDLTGRLLEEATVVTAAEPHGRTERQVGVP